MTNYLPDARRRGAEIYCEVDVRWVEPLDDGWRVRWQPVGVGRERYEDAAPLSVDADVVVLAAGCLGSTEILLRSAASGGLACSARRRHPVLRQRRRPRVRVQRSSDESNSVGLGHRRVRGKRPVGPCITGLVDRRSGPLEGGIIVEEGSIPGGLASLMPVALLASAKTDDVEPEPAGIGERLGRAGRIAHSLVGGAYTGAVRNTTTFLVMGHDGSDGRLVLDDDRVRIRWPGVSDRPLVRRCGFGAPASRRHAGRGVRPEPDDRPRQGPPAGHRPPARRLPDGCHRCGRRRRPRRPGVHRRRRRRARRTAGVRRLGRPPLAGREPVAHDLGAGRAQRSGAGGRAGMGHRLHDRAACRAGARSRGHTIRCRACSSRSGWPGRSTGGRRTSCSRSRPTTWICCWTTRRRRRRSWARWRPMRSRPAPSTPSASSSCWCPTPPMSNASR